MFLLPNQNKIDEDGVIDAMLDTDLSHRYFLDSVTGEVECVKTKAETEESRLPDPKRYPEVARTPVTTQLQWVKEFAEWCIEDQDFARSLQVEAEKEDAEKAFSRCVELLRADPNEFMYGWGEWQGTQGFDEMKKWFATLPISIEEKFEECEDCELCKLMEKEEHNLGDFLEAKAKEERKLNLGKKHTIDRTSLVKAEQRFLDALKRCGMDGFFSLRTFKKWCTNEEKYDPSFAVRALFFLAPEMTMEDDGEALVNAAMELANLLPRKKLGGESPLDFRESSSEHVKPKYETNSYDREPYSAMNEEALQFMRKSEYERAYLAYEKIIQKLLDERTPLFSSFRMYANAAVCCFHTQGELEPLGEPLLDAALRLNPFYDFALTMQDYYVAPLRNLSVLPKKERNFAKMLLAVMRDTGTRKYRRTPFRKYERFLTECGISLAYKTKTTPTVWKTDGRGHPVKIGRNDPCHCGSGKKYKKCCGK